MPPPTRLDGRARCDVWQPGLLSDATVSVDHGVATSYGVFGQDVAKLNADGSISSVGLFETNQGRVEGDRLRINGLLSDTVSQPITSGRVVLPGLIVDSEYYYSPTCSVAEAALGTLALYMLQQAAAQQARTK